MRQRSKDLSLAGEGLRVEVIVSMDCAARRVRGADESEALARSVVNGHCQGEYIYLG